MLDAKQISSLVESVSKVLPQGLGELPENAQKNLKASLTRVFEKMDLVSREEFDLQSAVLAKTREKLDALQKQVDALETSSDK
ncbi:MAG: accessory factor UbiK family protein [Hydrogenovibrio sp.]|nr:accessory factor UbiK family protein [Hydrogenovibrio sp.]